MGFHGKKLAKSQGAERGGRLLHRILLSVIIKGGSRGRVFSYSLEMLQRCIHIMDDGDKQKKQMSQEKDALSLEDKKNIYQRQDHIRN